MLGPKLSYTGSALPARSLRVVRGYEIEGGHGWCFRKTMRDDVVVATPKDDGSRHGMKRDRSRSEVLYSFVRTLTFLWVGGGGPVMA